MIYFITGILPVGLHRKVLSFSMNLKITNLHQNYPIVHTYLNPHRDMSMRTFYLIPLLIIQKSRHLYIRFK